MGHWSDKRFSVCEYLWELGVRSRRMEVLGYSSRSGKAKANGQSKKHKKKKGAVVK